MNAQTVPFGPKPRFLVGNLPEFNRDTLKFLLDVRPYGDFVQFRFGPFQVYAANHPDVVHEILVEKANSFYKPTMPKAIMSPIVGQGLFTNDGESWKRQRKLMQPVFHARRVNEYGGLMVRYADDMAREWQSGGERDIDREMNRLTMRIIAKTLFDADIAQDAPEIGAAITDALKLLELAFKRPFVLPRWLPTAENRHLRETVARLDTVIKGFIDERRKTGEDKGDFLSLLLSAQDDENKHMTDKQVRDEAMTLFGAGHETTAVTLMWVWYLLSQHPAVEARLHDELDRVLGGRLPTLDDLSKLPYVEMIVKETMRLYPAAWALTREAHEDVAIAGFPIKKGKIIFLNIYGIHHDPRYYPDPERFDPERFSPENEQKLPKYAYLPFGGGPRVCIGNAFSLMESRLILATLAQRFSLDLAPGFQVVPERLFTLRSRYGMKMIVQAREQIPAVG